MFQLWCTDGDTSSSMWTLWGFYPTMEEAMTACCERAPLHYKIIAVAEVATG